jgi:hypothetical protein
MAASLTRKARAISLIRWSRSHLGETEHYEDKLVAPVSRRARTESLSEDGSDVLIDHVGRIRALTSLKEAIPLADEAVTALPLRSSAIAVSTIQPTTTS